MPPSVATLRAWYTKLSALNVEWFINEVFSWLQYHFKGYLNWYWFHHVLTIPSPTHNTLLYIQNFPGHIYMFPATVFNLSDVNDLSSRWLMEAVPSRRSSPMMPCTTPAIPTWRTIANERTWSTSQLCGKMDCYCTSWFCISSKWQRLR